MHVLQVQDDSNVVHLIQRRMRIDEYKDERIFSVLQPQQNGGEFMGRRPRGVDAVRAR